MQQKGAPIEKRRRFRPKEEDHNEQKEHICNERDQAVSSPFKEEPQGARNHEQINPDISTLPQKNIGNCYNRDLKELVDASIGSETEIGCL